MKCKKCGAKASVNMRQHKLALCKEHYLEWVPEQTERFIKKYEMFSRDEKILVAVSGGKQLWARSVVPLTWKAGFSFARASADVSRRGPSSRSTSTPSDVVTGRISAVNRPASAAPIARW